MQWFRKKQKQTITAIRNSGNSTYIASVSQNPNQKPLVSIADKVDLDLSKAADIKKLVKEYELDKSQVSYLLEQHDHQHIQIEKPKVPPAELKEASRWALQDLINAPVEDLTIDLVDIPNEHSSDDENDFAYVFYANNNRIAEISNTLIDANVNLQTIEARVMAQRNIANLLAKPDEGEAVLSFSSAGVLITFTYQGEVCNARFIEMQMERSDTFFEKLALEIQRSLDGFEAKFRHVFIRRLYVAPFSIREQLCEHLKDSIYTDVEMFDLDSLLDFASDIDIGDLALQGSLLPVIGAALRSEAAA